MITIFRNIFAKEPYYVTVEQVLERIKTGKSKDLIDEVRKQISKDRADKIKFNLPSVCFSGKFTERLDEKLVEHSGFIVLDFDEVADMEAKTTEIINHSFVHACWISPRGNGLKVLIKIADGSKHREHFQALREVFPDADKSGVNVSRVCYESYDPGMYVNADATVFTKIKTIEKVEVREAVEDERQVFERILVWLTNRGDAFVTGERNNFMFKLASACSRFGIYEDNCFNLINTAFSLASNTFSISECQKAIRSAYRSNKGKFGSASFDREVLVDKVSRLEVELKVMFDPDERAKDVIFGEDVKAEAMDIYDKGYIQVMGIGVPDLDKHFKEKRGEPTLLSGYGNYGKSSYWKWRMLMRVILYKEKYAVFGPEDNPAEEFYHDFVEILLGCNCTPENTFRPSRLIYERAYDFVSKHIFYVYPEQIAPTPKYVKERFLELIIKENVDGVGIDPFNQMSNDYESSGGRDDRYLETFLSDWTRFLQANNVYGWIICHPRTPKGKDADGNYPCPDVFDLAGGAMWNNKMFNILIYHRPHHQMDKTSPICQLHAMKIKKQKTVGIPGMSTFEYVRSRRRYFFDGADPMTTAMTKMGLTFDYAQVSIEEFITDEYGTRYPVAPF